jgi:hypothetical protein
MYGVQLALRQRIWFSPEFSTWKTSEAPITRSKSRCTDTELLGLHICKSNQSKTIVTCVGVTLFFSVKLASNRVYNQDQIFEITPELKWPPLQVNWTLRSFMALNEFCDNSFLEEGIFPNSLREQINNG